MTLQEIGVKRLRERKTNEPLHWVVSIGMLDEVSSDGARKYAQEIIDASLEADHLNGKLAA